MPARRSVGGRESRPAPSPRLPGTRRTPVRARVANGGGVGCGEDQQPRGPGSLEKESDPDPSESGRPRGCLTGSRTAAEEESIARSASACASIVNRPTGAGIRHTSRARRRQETSRSRTRRETGRAVSRRPRSAYIRSDVDSASAAVALRVDHGHGHRRSRSAIRFEDRGSRRSVARWTVELSRSTRTLRAPTRDRPSRAGRVERQST